MTEEQATPAPSGQVVAKSDGDAVIRFPHCLGQSPSVITPHAPPKLADGSEQPYALEIIEWDNQLVKARLWDKNSGDPAPDTEFEFGWVASL